MTTGDTEINLMNYRLRGVDARRVLESAYERWGERLGMTTAFGYSGVYIMYLLRSMGIELDIYFVDTGHHFPETYEFADRLEREWDLRLHRISADETIRAHVRKVLGDRPWEVNSNLCCHFLKVAPLLEVLPEKDAWISGLRRDQSSSRSSIELFGRDSRGTLKVNPLAFYGGDELWSEIRKLGLPYHPLHEEGYMSIGCAPCTTPQGFDESERAGRWRESGKLECGLHL